MDGKFSAATFGASLWWDWQRRQLVTPCGHRFPASDAELAEGSLGRGLLACQGNVLLRDFEEFGTGVTADLTNRVQVFLGYDAR